MSLDAAEKGKAYAEKLLSKRVSRGRITEAKKAEVLALITPSANDEDLRACDLIIEAVFENIELKNKITASTEHYLAEKRCVGFQYLNTAHFSVGGSLTKS